MAEYDFDGLDKHLKTKTINVSGEFVDIYKNFNVSSQVDKMKSLSKKELYLLLILCLDFHSDEDPVCINNYKPFTTEINEINEVQDDKETNNQILKELIEETGDKYIDVDNLVDTKNEKLPAPLEKGEVRDAKILNILDKPE
jgi:hypothetical protein